MDEYKKVTIKDITPSHKNIHKDYEYHRYQVVPRGEFKQLTLSVYEIPPLKYACPYHYHSSNEEVFYILKGSGILRTPNKEEVVKPGDFLIFPTGEKGAHKIYNPSESEVLQYIDFDSVNEIDIATYPDSNKVGIWGKDINKVYIQDTNVDYYEGEE